MKRKVARRLQKALDGLKEVGQYNLLVKDDKGITSSITASGLTKKEAHENAIRMADVQFGVDGYMVLQFKKLF